MHMPLKLLSSLRCFDPVPCCPNPVSYMCNLHQPLPGCTLWRMAASRDLWLLFCPLCSWPDFSVSSVQVMKSLEDGYRLPPPVDCPSILYELMKSCWSHDRMRRPHFQEIRAQLQHFISSPQLLRPVADFDPR